MSGSARELHRDKRKKPCPSYGAVSDIGKARADNQDAFAVDSQTGLFIVSDGMGGAQAGALASQVVIRVLPEMLQAHSDMLKTAPARKVRRILRDSVAELSRELQQKSEDRPGLKGMGATVVATQIRQRWAHIVNMGDSRAYLLRGCNLTQLTEDHSVVALLLRNGEITVEAAKEHAARSHLTRFVGMPMDVLPDVRSVSLRIGDRLLLCTDGLTGMVPDEQLAAILTDREDPEPTCRRLIAAANLAGGRDNITAVVVDWQ